MKVAFGLKAHSGWAALVVCGESGGRWELVDRRRIELVGEGEADWAKQPYHAAETLPAADARRMVERGIAAAGRRGLREMRAAVERAAADGHAITGCAVLMGSPMPAWSVDQILAVHFRMHKAEGVLFREALASAATECGLRLVPVPEKELGAHAARALGSPAGALDRQIAALGRTAGPPWGKDQKDAALAALIALRARPPAGKKR
ncbi:MAG TPA: hypothetical protein VFB49_02445 [Patescibacteria group bacterium]|nr:hypothetical protein [Patescibacteria group bacterium]